MRQGSSRINHVVGAPSQLPSSSPGQSALESPTTMREMVVLQRENTELRQALRKQVSFSLDAYRKCLPLIVSFDAECHGLHFFSMHRQTDELMATQRLSRPDTGVVKRVQQENEVGWVVPHLLDVMRDSPVGHPLPCIFSHSSKRFRSWKNRMRNSARTPHKK